MTFNAGDVIAVYKKDGDWWTGKLNNVTGIFPSNYVTKIEVITVEFNLVCVCVIVFVFVLTNQTTVPVQTNPVAVDTSTGVSAAAVTSALESMNAANTQLDNEVSQINVEMKTGGERPFDTSMTANAQVCGFFFH